MFGLGPVARFNANKAAIELLEDIQATGREPTESELDTLASYTGWGALGQELFQGSWDRPRPKEGWEERDTWLRDQLGESAWKAAQGSILNAHYTDPPTVQAVWSAVEAMGFKGGRVLEPSMGVGNFFGMMPQGIAKNSKLTGIELDETTGGIAQILYPEANVRIHGYEKSKTPDGFYDLVIGNWPFAATGPSDRRYNDLKASLHDYFFVKALDQVRPGGLVVGITSAGTMDKQGQSVRQHLARNAELVASFRLPSGAFEGYAGTKVVTDLIILKKREAPVLSAKDSGWLDAVDVDTPAGEKIRVNEYYAKNGDQVLGTLNFGHGTTYGRPAMIVDRPKDYAKRLHAIKDRVPSDAYTPIKRGNETRFITNNTDERVGTVVARDDGLWVVQGDQLAALNDIANYELKDRTKTKAREDEIRALISVRQAYGKTIDAERDGHEKTEEYRAELKKAYDTFVKKHGPLAKAPMLKVMDKAGDPSVPMLEAIERKDGTPSAILTQPLTRAQVKLEKPTISQAFVQARNESATLDLDRVAEIANVPRAKVEADLLGQKAIYRLPGDTFDVADAVLSGNVRKRMAQLLDARDNGEKGLDSTIEAIQAVIPEDIPYHKIEANLGAAWMKPETFRSFIASMLNLSETQAGDVHVVFRAGSWFVKFTDPSINKKSEARAEHGHSKVDFSRMVRAAMNNETLKIMGRDEEGNKVTDEDSTKEANAKVDQLREKFRSWIWADPERRVETARRYNDIMNAMADPSFDGSFLEFPGMALQIGDNPFNLRSHQVNAIWRGLLKGRGIYAHEVGTGKTFTMAGLAVESRRYGLARKPMIVAHNANSATVAKEINDMYPGAKVLYVDNLAPKSIKRTLYAIRNDDWDAVVIPHSLIDQMTLSEETLRAMTEGEIAALEDAALEAAEEDGESLSRDDLDDEDSLKKVRSVTAKELAKARLALIKRLEDNIAKATKADAVTFEDLGVDMLLVDEIHEFKKPAFATKMQMKGLNKQPSGRSLQMQFLTRYIRGINAGRGVHSFTGTPITNTLGEMFHQMRYVMEDTMAEANVDQWDSWFNTFAAAETDLEIASDGQFEPVTRLSAFVNVADLRRLAADTLDVVFADEMPEFAPRETASGKTLSDNLSPEEEAELRDGRTENPVGRPYKKVVNMTAEMSPAQRAVQQDLADRYNRFRRASKKTRYEIIRTKGGDERNPLIIEGEAANAALDIRILNPEAEDHPESKVNRMVRQVMAHYAEHPKASQVIFMDKGYDNYGTKGGKKVDRLNIAKDIKEKLIAAGVDAKEIAVVTGSTSKIKRKEIAAKVAEGEIRIVMGGTSTLGVGVNMQENLRAMHHMDAPWMPGELEQRNGRGQRQGNRWNTVMEYRYMTERLDAKRWQALAKKQTFIRSFMEADMNTRFVDGDAADATDKESADDITDSLSDAAGDPRIMQRAKLNLRVTKLRDRKSMHESGADTAAVEIKRLERMISMLEAGLPKLKDDAAHVAKIKESETFSATIGGTTYHERADAIEALDTYVDKWTPPPGTRFGKRMDMGVVVNGFSLKVSLSGGLASDKYSMERKAEYVVGKPTIASMEANMRNIPKAIAKDEAEVETHRRSVESLKKSASEPFPQADELAQKEQQLKAIESDLESNPIPAPAWLRNGAVMDTKIKVDGETRIVTGHRWGPDDYFILTDEGDVPYLEVRGEDGGRLFDEHQWIDPPEAADRTKERVAHPTRPVETAVRASIPDLQKRLDAMNLKRVRVQTDPDKDRLGAFQAFTNGQLQILVNPSLDGVATLYHESIHAMRELGLFTPREWKALEIAAARKWVEKHDIAKRYPDLLPAEQIEEAVAEEFAEAMTSKKSPTGSMIVQAFNKIARFLKAFGNALRGAGFQAAEDILGRAADGTVGARDRGQGVQAVLKERRRTLRSARVPKRQTAQARAHAAAGGMLHPHIPDRRVWEELTDANASMGQRLREARGAISDWVDKRRVVLQDKFLPVRRAQEAVLRASGQAAISEAHNAYLAEETFSGKVGRHLFEIDEQYVKPILEIMAGGKGEAMLDIEQVGNYLYARHAKERNAQIAKIDPGKTDGSGMSDAEADFILNTVKASPDAKRFRDVAALIDQLRERTIVIREDAGLLSSTEADIWRNQYSAYVPLKGFAETDHAESMLDLSGIGKNYQTRGPESMRALGRKSEAFNPLVGAIVQAQETAIRAEKNRVGQAMYQLAKDFSSPRLFEVKKPQQKRVYNRATGLVETRTISPLAEMKPNEMAVKVAGKERRIVFHDKRLAEAAGNVGADVMGPFTQMMSAFGRYFSAVNTMLNPVFTIVNGIRDMITAQISIGHFGGKDANRIRAAMLKNWPKAFAGALGGMKGKEDTDWQKYYREFDEAGGKVSFWVLEQPEAKSLNLARRLKDLGGSLPRRQMKYLRFSSTENPILGVIERTNLAVDNAVRLAAFVEARKAGWTKAEAASLSKNMTVNFNRRGTSGAHINALWVFANAAIQGTHTLARSMKSRNVQKILATIVAVSVLQDLVNAALSEEDEDGELAYDKLPTWKTEMNSVFILGGDAVTFPLPYGYNIFSFGGQQAGKVARGVKDLDEAMADLGSAFLGAFAPISGDTTYSMIMPTILDPVSEMAMNEDWLGRPIRPENPWSDHGPQAYKFYQGASTASKVISDALNRGTGGSIAEPGLIDISPEYIDHLSGFLAGGAGRFVGQVGDLTTKVAQGDWGSIEQRDIPFANKVWTRTGDWLDRDRFYRFRDEVMSAEQARKGYAAAGRPVPDHIKRTARLLSAVRQADKELRAHRKRRATILDAPNVATAERNAALNDLEKRASSVYLGFNRKFIAVNGRQAE